MATDISSQPSGGSAGIAAGACGLVRLLYTHNPFYLISAWFVFTGLRISFDPQGAAFNTTALMMSLAGYMLVLAITAWTLIHLGQVWQDVRTILLLILVMFVAFSVTIDDVLAASLERGAICYVAGLMFCIALTEALLRWLPIRLPTLYRLPFHLLLGLFFLYPLALAPLLGQPNGAAMQWGLFAFPSIGGLVLLLLIPAIRRGPAYVENNGTPWRWPLYPWSVFFFLMLGIAGRGYYLCISLHQVGGMGTIFAPYFLMPLALAVCLLLLEMGLTTGNHRLQQAAMFSPLAAAAIVALPLGGGFVHDRFLELFFRTLGASPLFCTMLGVACFHAFAAWRRVPHAGDWTTLTLAAWSFVGPRTVDVQSTWQPWGAPLAAAALLQLVLAWRRQSSPRALLAASSLCLALAIDLSGTPWMAYYGALPAHVWLIAVLMIGMVFKDDFARWLQGLGAWLLMGATLFAVTIASQWPGMPDWLTLVYPLVSLSVGLACFWHTRHPLHLIAAAVCLACWLTSGSVQVYEFLRPRLAGLDKLVWGLIFFVCAAVISLLKSGRLQRWLSKRQGSQLAD